MIIQISFFSFILYAQSNQQRDTAEISETGSEVSKQRMTFVKMVDFYLRDGSLVFGKLVSEDKNKIIEVFSAEIKGQSASFNSPCRAF